MFQSVAADLVEDFCGKYLDGVDPSQINVSMWNGSLNRVLIFCTVTVLVLNCPIALVIAT
jgi:hypothetical protein